jgi:MOZ/SAS family
MPNYQRQGFGRFLIDFSYLLSRTEGTPGTPEKPLSDLGRVSYHAYWKSVVMEYLGENRSAPVSISSISQATGLQHQDIAQAFHLLGFLKCRKNGDGDDNYSAMLCVDWIKVDAYMDRVSKSKSRIKIDPECLRWTPLLINYHPIVRESDTESQLNESIISSTMEVPEKKISVVEALQSSNISEVRVIKRRKKNAAALKQAMLKEHLEKIVKAREEAEGEADVEMKQAPFVEESPQPSNVMQPALEDTPLLSTGRRKMRPSRFNEAIFEELKSPPSPVEIEAPKRGRKRKQSKLIEDIPEPAPAAISETNLDDTPIGKRRKLTRNSRIFDDSEMLDSPIVETPKKSPKKQPLVDNSSVESDSISEDIPPRSKRTSSRVIGLRSNLTSPEPCEDLILPRSPTPTRRSGRHLPADLLSDDSSKASECPKLKQNLLKKMMQNSTKKILSPEPSPVPLKVPGKRGRKKKNFLKTDKSSGLSSDDQSSGAKKQMTLLEMFKPKIIEKPVEPPPAAPVIAPSSSKDRKSSAESKKDDKRVKSPTKNIEKEKRLSVELRREKTPEKRKSTEEKRKSIEEKLKPPKEVKSKDKLSFKHKPLQLSESSSSESSIEADDEMEDEKRQKQSVPVPPKKDESIKSKFGKHRSKRPSSDETVKSAPEKVPTPTPVELEAPKDLPPKKMRGKPGRPASVDSSSIKEKQRITLEEQLRKENAIMRCAVKIEKLPADFNKQTKPVEVEKEKEKEKKIEEKLSSKNSSPAPSTSSSCQTTPSKPDPPPKEVKNYQEAKISSKKHILLESANNSKHKAVSTPSATNSVNPPPPPTVEKKQEPEVKIVETTPTEIKKKRETPPMVKIPEHVKIPEGTMEKPEKPQATVPVKKSFKRNQSLTDVRNEPKVEQISVITGRKSFENTMLPEIPTKSLETSPAKKSEVEPVKIKTPEKVADAKPTEPIVDHRKSSEIAQSVLKMNDSHKSLGETIRPNVIVDTKQNKFDVDDKVSEKVEPNVCESPKKVESEKETEKEKVEKSVIKHKSEMIEKMEEKKKAEESTPPKNDKPSDAPVKEQQQQQPPQQQLPLQSETVSVVTKASSDEKLSESRKNSSEQKPIEQLKNSAEVKSRKDSKDKVPTSVLVDGAKNSCSRTTETKRPSADDHPKYETHNNSSQSSVSSLPHTENSNSSSSSSQPQVPQSKKSDTSSSSSSKKDKLANQQSNLQTGSKNSFNDSSKLHQESSTNRQQPQYHNSVMNAAQPTANVNNAQVQSKSDKTQPSNPKHAAAATASAIDIHKNISQYPSMNQFANYSSHNPYWPPIEPSFYSYNMTHLDPANSKSPNKFQLDLATSMAYNANLQQNLYSNAFHSQHYQQQQEQYQQNYSQHHLQQQSGHMQQQNMYNNVANAAPATNQTQPSAKDKKSEKKAEKHKAKANEEAKIAAREQQYQQQQQQLQYDPSACATVKQQQQVANNYNNTNQKPSIKQNHKADKIAENSCMLSSAKVAAPTQNASCHMNIQQQQQQLAQHHQQQQQQMAKSNNLNNSIMATSLNKNYATEELQHQQHIDATMMSHQQTPPSSSGDIQSMGVYTPDSTTNSVHSLHHYGQCDLDVNQLELESPASIASDMASQNSVESIRPPSVLPQQMNQYSDCQMQQQPQGMPTHMNITSTHVPASSPQHQIVNNQTNQVATQAMHQQTASTNNRKLNQMNRNGNGANANVSNNGAARSSTPKISRNTATPGLQQQHPQQQQQQQQQQARHRATPPIHANQPMVSPVQQHLQHQNLNQQQLQHLHLQQMQQSYHHQGMHQSNYLSPQMGGNSGVNNANYAQAQSPNYGTGQPTGVIAQHRSMTNTHPNMPIQNSLPSPSQRLGPSPSSCAVSSSNNNYYAHGPQSSHTPGPISTPTPSATPTPQMDQQSAICQQQNQLNMSNNSLSKLQQLASLDNNTQQICNTPPSVVLTPPPHSHVAMSPAPHLLNQNRSISTPPQSTLGFQYKIYGNMPPSIGQNTGRNARTPAPPSVQHMTSGPPSRVSPNVASIGSAMMQYRYQQQASAGYIPNPSFINNSSGQIPVMQPQYQDPSAIQRAQQNSMYYNHYALSPLNGSSMRR